MAPPARPAPARSKTMRPQPQTILNRRPVDRVTIDEESGPPTCLSALHHDPAYIRDHLQHYFGCIKIADRIGFWDENNDIWKHERNIEIERLRSEAGETASDESITKDATARVAKKIGSLAVSINAQYKRTEILRGALSKAPEPNAPSSSSSPGDYPVPSAPQTILTALVAPVPLPASAAIATPATPTPTVPRTPATPASPVAIAPLVQPENLVSCVEDSAKRWRNSQVYKNGIEMVNTWKTKNQGEGETVNVSRVSWSAQEERARVQDVIMKHRGVSAIDTEIADYDLERDVNAYLIQYTRPTRAENNKEVSAPTPTMTESPKVTSAATGFPGSLPSSASQSMREDHLHPIDEELTDIRFKGRFPDQRVSMSLLLENAEEPAKNILSRELCKEKDPNRIRYLHIPSNNMKWIEQVIAGYYDDKRPDLSNMNRDPPVKTRTHMLLRPQFWRGQQHGARSGVVHARHMRPLCERVSSEVNEIEDNPKNIVLFMPYMHWETDRMRNTLSKMIDAESEKQRQKNEALRFERRKKRKSERIGLEPGLKKIEHPDEKPHEHLADIVDKNSKENAKKHGILRTFTDLSGLAHKSVNPANDQIEIGPNGRLMLKNRQKHPLGQYLIDAARLYEAMSIFRDQKMLTEYLYHDPPLHPRRTLDQSYYWTLKTTKVRDRDQVVYRGTNMNLEFCHKLEPPPIQKPKHWWQKEKKDGDSEPQLRWKGHWSKTDEHGCDHCKTDIKKVSQLIMVDQLWMWVLDERTVITSFPRRYGYNKSDMSGIHKSIRTRLKSARKNQIKSVYDLALIILDECSNTFFDRTKTEDSQPQVMDIFSESIGNVTNQHTISFQHVWHWTQKASAVYRSKSKLVESSQLHVPLLDIHPEGKLQREVKDIIDELDIMIHIHRKQKEVIRRFCKHVEHILDPQGRWRDSLETSGPSHHRSIPHPADHIQKQSEREDKKEQLFWFHMQSQELLSEVDDRVDELEGLRKGAESTAKSVNDLLSLKQQQASVVQAWESVNQAEEAVRQGRSIMMFTTITIIFLPLSFMSSFFGMNNIELGSDGTQWTMWDEVKWMVPVSFLIILISVIITFSNFLRAVIWSLYTYLTAWLMVKLRLYRLWLNFSEEWNAANLMRKTEEAVERMKEDVRKAKRVRRGRKTYEARKKAEATAKNDKAPGEKTKKKQQKPKSEKNNHSNGAPPQNDNAAQLPPLEATSGNVHSRRSTRRSTGRRTGTGSNRSMIGEQQLPGSSAQPILIPQEQSQPELNLEQIATTSTSGRRIAPSAVSHV